MLALDLGHDAADDAGANLRIFRKLVGDLAQILVAVLRAGSARRKS
jgi:hypothetical protein